LSSSYTHSKKELKKEDNTAVEEDDKRQEKKEMDRIERKILERQKQIATYFVASIGLYADLCGGRSHKATTVLQKEFSFETLLNILCDDHLSAPARGNFMKLMNNLWVSQYPHAENCGRQTIPKRIWIASTLNKKYVDMFLKGSTNDWRSTAENILPRFNQEVSTGRQLKIQSADDGPEFVRRIDDEKKIKELSDLHKYKFHLLAVLVKDYFSDILNTTKKNKENGPSTLTNDDVIAIRQCVEMARLLFSYGFIPHLSEIDVLRENLIKLLFVIKNEKKTGKKRYDEKDEMNYNCMQAKTEILKLLLFEMQIQQEIKLAGNDIIITKYVMIIKIKLRLP
jgi:hypothetical protein